MKLWRNKKFQRNKIEKKIINASEDETQATKGDR